YMTQEYQTSMELALKDQILLAGSIKYAYNQLKIKLTQTTYKSVGRVVSIYNTVLAKSSNEYNPIADTTGDVTGDTTGDTTGDDLIGDDTLVVDADDVSVITDIHSWDYELIPVADDFMRLLPSNHLVMPSNTMEQFIPPIDRRITNINELVARFPETEFYLYYVETDHDIDFIHYENTHQIINYMMDHINTSVKVAVQWVTTFESYTDTFYKTDHHWNENGQMIGYQNIVTLLGEVPDPNVSIKILENALYVGSRAKQIDDYTVVDDFGILFNDTLKYTVEVNGVEAVVNQKPWYNQGFYSTEIGVNHYAVCFGYDKGLIGYNFDQEEKDNLLVFAASFSNPINELIASHFNHTYVVDLRHYEKDMGTVFDMDSFIKEHDIDKVLYTGYYAFYAGEKFLIN
ncbi:MAG: hypothetical protein PF505_02190, partial [Vallitaleaceae bacterium]|nr:hypothetical protein [Vallitaleaceae bacterium]